MLIRKFGKRIVHFFTFLYQHTEGFLMAVLAILLVIDVLTGILARFVHFEVVFATELGKYIFIWLCAIGISTAAKDNQHVRIHFIAQRLPLNPRVTWIVSQVLFLVFTFFFFYWGLKLTWMHFEMHKSAMGFNFPMYIFTAAIPIGFALTSIRLIQNILFSINKSKKITGWDIRIPEGMPGSSDEF